MGAVDTSLGHPQEQIDIETCVPRDPMAEYFQCGSQGYQQG